MTKAIFFKELLKTRRAFVVSLLLAVLFAIYAIMCVRRVSSSHGVEHVWLIMLMKDQTFIDAIKYLPPVLGIVLGLAQMAPEMQQKRLKLTLHLPYPTTRLVLAMLGAGLGELLVVFALQAAIIGAYYSGIVTPEMNAHVLLTAVPWYLAGLAAYLFTASVCLEGTWRRRVLLGLIGIGVVTVFYQQGTPQAYNGIIAGAVVYLLLALLLSVHSVNRFKEGRID